MLHRRRWWAAPPRGTRQAAEPSWQPDAPAPASPHNASMVRGALQRARRGSRAMEAKRQGVIGAIRMPQRCSGTWRCDCASDHLGSAPTGVLMPLPPPPAAASGHSPGLGSGPPMAALRQSLQACRHAYGCCQALARWVARSGSSVPCPALWRARADPAAPPRRPGRRRTRWAAHQTARRAAQAGQAPGSCPGKFKLGGSRRPACAQTTRRAPMSRLCDAPLAPNPCPQASAAANGGAPLPPAGPGSDLHHLHASLDAAPSAPQGGCWEGQLMQQRIAMWARLAWVAAGLRPGGAAQPTAPRSLPGTASLLPQVPAALPCWASCTTWSWR